MVIIAIGNHKGGVGKTTTTFNLGAALAKRNKVLLIDLDFQGSLTTAVGLEPNSFENTSYQVLKGLINASEAIVEGLEFDIMPSNSDIAGADLELADVVGREGKLKRALSMLNYDYVLIDCPPSLNLVSVNALVAADYVIVPVSTDYLAYKAFALYKDTIIRIKDINPGLELMGILPTFYEKKTLHSREVLEALEKTEENLFKTVIKRSVVIADSVMEHVPVRKNSIFLDMEYDKLAKEVIKYVKKRKR